MLEPKLGESDREEQVRREIQTNDLIEMTLCSHLLRCKGHGSRRLTRIVNDTSDIQHTVFIHQEFAAYRNLAKSIEDDQENQKYVLLRVVK
jgi:hypothetical protein